MELGYLKILWVITSISPMQLIYKTKIRSLTIHKLKFVSNTFSAIKKQILVKEYKKQEKVSKNLKMKKRF